MGVSRNVCFVKVLQRLSCLVAALCVSVPTCVAGVPVAHMFSEVCANRSLAPLVEPAALGQGTAEAFSAPRLDSRASIDTGKIDERLANVRNSKIKLFTVQAAFVFSYCFLACYIGLLLRESCSSSSGCSDSCIAAPGEREGLFRAIVGAIKSAGSSLMRSAEQAAFPDRNRDPHHVEIRRKADEMRLEFVRCIAQILFDLLALVLAVMTVVSARDGLWLDMSNGLVDLYLQHWDILGVVVAFAASMVVVMRPSAVTLCTTKVYFVVCAVKMMCQAVVLTEEVAPCNEFAPILPVGTFAMFLASLVCGDPCFVTVVNTCLVSVEFCVYASSFGGPWSPDRHWFTYGLQLCLAVAGSTIVCALFQWAMTERARAHFHELSVTQSESVVKGLLSVVCDAIVHLGPADEFLITSPAPKLASLLLRPNSHQHLEGSSFLDYMDLDDKKRFKELTGRGESPQCGNVVLRGADAVSVEVKLYTSSFMDASGQEGHIVGICELGDHTPAELLSLEGTDLRTAGARGSASASGDAGADPGRSASQSNIDSVSRMRRSTSRGSGLMRGSSEKEDEISVLVDAVSPVLEIVQYTLGFALLLGAVPGHGVGVLEYIADGAQLLEWAQSHVNAFANGHKEETKRFAIALRTPLYLQLGLEIHATCRVSLEVQEKEEVGQRESKSNSSDTDDLGSILLRMTFHKVRRKRLPPPAGADAAGGGIVARVAGTGASSSIA